MKLRIKKDNYKKKYQESLPNGREPSPDSVEMDHPQIDDKINEYKREIKTFKNQNLLLTKENNYMKE